MREGRKGREGGREGGEGGREGGRGGREGGREGREGGREGGEGSPTVISECSRMPASSIQASTSSGNCSVTFCKCS